MMFLHPSVQERSPLLVIRVTPSIELFWFCDNSTLIPSRPRVFILISRDEKKRSRPDSEILFSWKCEKVSGLHKVLSLNLRSEISRIRRKLRPILENLRSVNFRSYICFFFFIKRSNRIFSIYFSFTKNIIRRMEIYWLFCLIYNVLLCRYI